MAPVAVKAGVLLAVAAAGSTSVWYFSDSIFGSPLISIAGENPSSDYGNTSIGKNYSRYFLSSKNKNNRKVWEKRFNDNRNKFAGTESTDNPDKSKDKFGTVTTPYGNENTALNKVCEEAYKLTADTSLSNTDLTSEDTSKFMSSNVWKFCGLGPIFTLEADAGNYNTTSFPNTKIGGDTSNRKILVSTKKEENNWFWKIREEEFKKAEGERSKNKVQGTDKSKNAFAKLKEDADPKNLMAVCEETYKKEPNNDDDKNKTDAELFCSIKLTISTAEVGA